MDSAEVFWRLGHACTVSSERIAFHLGRYNWPQSTWQSRLCGSISEPPEPNALADWWLEHMHTRHEPPFLLDDDTLSEAMKRYQQIYPGRLNCLIKEADLICRGQVSFLGIDLQLLSGVAWQRDPVTHRDWPATFYADVQIPFCDGTGGQASPGDSKHVWELNRHEFLIDCARAFFLTKDDRYARHVLHMVTDWIAANPYLQGVNWAGPLEVALRSMAWLWLYQFCRTWRDLSPEEHFSWIKAFYLHGHYLDRHLEVYSSPNNHLIGEATALYLLGSFFPEFDRATAWRTRAWAILEAEPQRQFYADGGSTEQATSYHHYCLGFYTLAVLTRMRQQLPVPTAMLDRLESAFSFSMWMTTPDGTVPRIGDTDNARSIRLGPFNPWDFRNLLSIGAVLFRRSDFKAAAHDFSEDALWLLGLSGARVFQELSSTPPTETIRLFPLSGYAILRDGWQREGHHTCLDCGEIGLNLRADDVPIFTHGHADMLSVTISTYGEPLLVDSGFYTYNGPPDWHRYTRDIQGHNTIRLDGQSQAKFHKKNAWACASRPGKLTWDSRDGFDCVEGSHSGFLSVSDCTCHRRAVVWNRESCWLIVDRLEGTGRHYVEVFFHFAPGRLHVHPDGNVASVITDRGLHAVLQTTDIHTIKMDAWSGETEPERGWIAAGYGYKQRAPVVKFHGHLQLPCTLSFVLSAFLESAMPPNIEQYEIVDNLSKRLIDSVSMRVATTNGEQLLVIGPANLEPTAIASSSD